MSKGPEGWPSRNGPDWCEEMGCCAYPSNWEMIETLQGEWSHNHPMVSPHVTAKICLESGCKQLFFWLSWRQGFGRHITKATSWMKSRIVSFQGKEDICIQNFRGTSRRDLGIEKKRNNRLKNLRVPLELISWGMQEDDKYSGAAHLIDI